MTASRSTKPKKSVAKVRTKAKDTALKATSWYQAAARAVGISYGRQSEKISLS
jgi:hypothetical protein